MERRRKRNLTIGGIALIWGVAGLCPPALGEIVPGTSNPYLAGMPPGSTDNGTDLAPDQSPVLVTSIDVTTSVSFSVSATGGVFFAPGCGIPADSGCDPPDGGSQVGAHATSNGIAGVTAPLDALMGVFLDDAQPDSTAAPGGLDFSSSGIGIEFTTLSPALKQPFFIGDGTTTGGQVQEFVVPAGATRLFLGVHDGIGWFNNSGEIDATLTAAAPPVPAMSARGLLLVSLLVGVAGSIGLTMRRLRDRAA